MRRQIKVISLLLMVLWLTSVAAAVEKPAVGQGATDQLTIGAQDVVTASDAGGGHLSDRDILIVVLIVLAVIGLAVII
jgi:small-conductance mechanosensitive channel